MNEKDHDIRGLTALLIGNNAERPGIHLQRTAAFHWGTRFHIGCRGLGRIQPLEPRNKVRGESSGSHDSLMEGGTVIKVLRYRE